MASKTKVDLSEFYKLSRPKKPPCRIGFALEQFDGGERVQLEAALGSDVGIITNSAIQQWLAARQQEVSISALVSHRKGTCTCAYNG